MANSLRKLIGFGRRDSLAKSAEYRKTIKIYDIFTFFNELDLLEIRLNILDRYVDYFVIIESTETFSGQSKRLTYQENKDRFVKFHHKILHFIISDTPSGQDELQQRLLNANLSDLEREIINHTLTTDNVVPGVVHWLKEFYQKESIKKALVGLKDDDMCFVSDVDEIWNPAIKIDYSKNHVYKLRQLMYAYYLNNRSSEAWAGTLATHYATIKNSCLNHLRTASKTKYTYVKNGGWHFTNQGGADKIRDKIEASYGPQDYNNEDVKSKITERMSANQDYIGRGFKFWKDESDLPSYLLDHKATYQHLFS